MEKVATPIPDLWVIKPRVFKDDRGYFFESFNQQKFDALLGESFTFVQDNQSFSHKNALRGLHLQAAPYAQGKLVRVITGAVIDVAVDVRKGSPTYGQHFSIELTGENKTMLWIPPGFAHGFTTLEDNTIFAYKCTADYNKESERTILWNDTDLAVDWQNSNPILSDKDQQGMSFKSFTELL